MALTCPIDLDVATLRAEVQKPAGRVQIADIVIGEVLPDEAMRDIDLWTG